MLKLLIFLPLVFASISTLWPQPSSLSAGSGAVFAKNLTWNQIGFSSNTIKEACDRYTGYIFQVPAADGIPKNANEVNTVEIRVASKDETLQLGVDETYTLTIAAPSPVIKITAQTVYGALRAIETLSQIFDYDVATKQYIGQSVTISDKPRYPWRGLMIDTSRHYLPLSFIKTHVIEAMAFNKMNSLHWHLVDAQSWPLVVPDYPLLAKRGAYAPEAVYTPQDVADIVEYARKRGIRVIPEFDLPGHTYAVGKGYPQMVAHCPSYEKNINNVPINPTNNMTYDMIRAVFSTLARACPDEFVHTGGDEVVFGCWQQDAEIASWAKARGYTMAQLEGYFMGLLQKIVHSDLKKTMIVWEEAWMEKAISLDKSAVVEAWRSIDVLHQIVASGYKGLLAAPWYLDKQVPDLSSKTHYEWIDTWRDFYAVDPDMGKNGPVPVNANLILGGEACMWAEQVDEASFDGRVWPRASAVGERLWSPGTVSDITAAIPRLNTHSCRMKRRGIHSGPVAPSSYCPMLQ